MQTKVLYYDSICLLDFEANILQIEEKDGEYYVVLDQTAFYPDSGGMCCDIGLIDNIEVVRVIKYHDEIVHVLKEEPTNTKVKCHVDEYTRKTNIQIHDAQHLLTAILEKDYDLITISHHVHGNYCDLVVSGPELTSEILYEVERFANECIIENRRLDIQMVRKADLAKFGLEDNPKYTDPVRLTNIEGLNDNNACGCLHFETLGPIQAIKCLGVEKTGKNFKILFTSGLKMINFFDTYNDIVKELKILTKGNEDTVISKVKEIQTKNINLTKELNETKSKCYELQLDNFVNDNIIIFEGPDNNFDDLRTVGHLVVNGDRDIYGLLQMKKDDKYQFILVKQKDSSYSLEDLFNKLKTELNVQGGGKGLMINGQSSVDLTKEIKKYL